MATETVPVPITALAGLLAAYSTVTAPTPPSPQRMADAIAGGDNAYDTLKALLDEAES